MTKTADPTIVLETGANVEFTFTVTNNSAEEATLDSLVDNQFGDLNGQGDCFVPQALAPGGQYTCSVTVFIQGDADEGIIVRIVTGANNSVQSVDVHVIGVVESF